MEERKLSLWAIAFEVHRRVKGRTLIVDHNIDYVQDVGLVEAKFQWRNANPNYITHRIVAVGPAIGLFVKDKVGMVLSAD